MDPSGFARTNDVAELLGRYQPALRLHRVGELLPGRHRLRTDLPCRVDVVLRLQRGDDLGRRDAELCQLIRLDPHPQRVLSAEHLHTPDTLDAGQLVLQVDDGVVGQEVRAVLAVRRAHRDNHERRGLSLLHHDAGRVDLRRQLGLRLRHAQLRQHLIDIGIRFDVEVHVHRRLPVVGVLRVHVNAVVDTVDLLLDGCSNGLYQCARVGSRVGRLHLHLGRNDVGILRGWQRQHRHATQDHRQDGDHDRHDRPADKELRHGLPPGRLVGGSGWRGISRRLLRAHRNAVFQLLQIVQNDRRTPAPGRSPRSSLCRTAGPA